MTRQTLAESIDRMKVLAGIKVERAPHPHTINEQIDDIDMVNMGYSVDTDGRNTPNAADYDQVTIVQSKMRKFESGQPGQGYFRYEFESVDDHGNIWKGDVKNKDDIPRKGETFSVQYLYRLSDNQYDETFTLKP